MVYFEVNCVVLFQRIVDCCEIEMLLVMRVFVFVGKLLHLCKVCAFEHTIDEIEKLTGASYDVELFQICNQKVTNFVVHHLPRLGNKQCQWLVSRRKVVATNLGQIMPYLRLFNGTSAAIRSRRHSSEVTIVCECGALRIGMRLHQLHRVFLLFLVGTFWDLELLLAVLGLIEIVGPKA